MAAPKGLSVYEHGCKCEILTIAGDDQGYWLHRNIGRTQEKPSSLEGHQ